MFFLSAVLSQQWCSWRSSGMLGSIECLRGLMQGLHPASKEDISFNEELELEAAMERVRQQARPMRG